MSSVTLATVEKIIAEVASVEIMPRFQKLAAGDIEMKGVNDPVTVADKAAELALIRRLTDAFPGSVVVGEEGFASDPAILDRLGGEQDVWVIDPIDGTRHFIEGSPTFGVMIAQVRRGQTVAAWIHDPHTGDTLTAEQGGGVWLGGHKMRLAGHDPAISTVGLTGSKLRPFLLTSEVEQKLTGLPRLEQGASAAFDYARFFTGDALFAQSTQPRASFMMTYRRAMPWDHLPGLLMLAETGGYSACWGGDVYKAQQPVRGLIVTADESLYHRLSESLKEVFESPGIP